MAKLSKEQEEQLAELERLRDAPDEPEGDDDAGDDGHVIVLRGSRADSFLESLLRPDPKQRKSGNAARPPAKTQRSQKGANDQGAADDDQGDGDDDDQGAADDAPAQRTNRYFR